VFDTGGAQTIIVRRNVVTDSYSTDSHAQGIYVSKVAKLTIEENFFTHNGFNETVPGAEKTIFNHNIYLQVTIPGR